RTVVISTVEANDASTAESQRQIQFAAFNARRLRPALPESAWREALHRDMALLAAEHEFIEYQRQQVADRAREAPREASAFADWFAALDHTGPGQHDPLFPYLAEQATHEEMCWFLTQEVAGEAGFDDLVA